MSRRHSCCSSGAAHRSLPKTLIRYTCESGSSPTLPEQKVRLPLKPDKSIAAKPILNMRAALEGVDRRVRLSPTSARPAHASRPDSRAARKSSRPPSRCTGVVFTMLAALGVNSACAQQAEPAKVEALMKTYDCMNCHGIDKRIVGPAFAEVAAKYKGVGGAEAKLMEKVRNGGSGAWGPVPMPPNPKLSDADL